MWARCHSATAAATVIACARHHNSVLSPLEEHRTGRGAPCWLLVPVPLLFLLARLFLFRFLLRDSPLFPLLFPGGTRPGELAGTVDRAAARAERSKGCQERVAPGHHRARYNPGIPYSHRNHVLAPLTNRKEQEN